MSAPFPSPAAAAVNHVLRSMPLAMERLRKHAGRTVAIQVGPSAPAFTVQTTGEVTAALPATARDLTVRISPALLPRLLARDDAAYRDIQMEGDMELAHEISFLARHVTWDVEEDLSKWVGDIAAHRIVGTLRELGRWGREAAVRSAQGAAEYWTEESPLVATRVKVGDFVRAVDTLRDDVERLEKRIERL